MSYTMTLTERQVQAIRSLYREATRLVTSLNPQAKADLAVAMVAVSEVLSQVEREATYVTTDGTWGDADGLMVILDPERGHTDEEYAMLNACADNDRWDLLWGIARWAAAGRPALSETHLDINSLSEAIIDKYGDR